MSFLKKIQQQPEYVRKLILWITIIIVGLILMIFWVLFFLRKIKEFPKEEFVEKLNLPSLEAEIDKINKFSEINIKRGLKELEKQVINNKQ